MGYFLILPTHIFTHRYLRLSSLLCCFNTQLFQQPVTIKKPSQILSRKKVFLHKCLKKKYIRYHTNQHKHHRYYSRWYGVVICVSFHVLFLLAENEYEKKQVFFWLAEQQDWSLFTNYLSTWNLRLHLSISGNSPIFRISPFCSKDPSPINFLSLYSCNSEIGYLVFLHIQSFIYAYIFLFQFNATLSINS